MQPDFVNKQKLYEGYFDKAMSQAEIMQTIDYKGFVDGHENNPNDYTGRQGTPEEKPHIRGFHIDDIVEGADVHVVPGSEEAMRELTKDRKQIAQLRYEDQYEVGQNWRTRSPPPR